MSDLKSPSFPNGVRGELIEFRQRNESGDLGIPSDSDPMGAHLIEPYEAEAFDHLYQPSRYDGTVCEPGLTHHQQKMARLWHNIERAVVVALWIVGASFLVMTAIQQFGAQHDREVVAQVHGWEGGR